MIIYYIEFKEYGQAFPATLYLMCATINAVWGGWNCMQDVQIKICMNPAPTVMSISLAKWGLWDLYRTDGSIVPCKRPPQSSGQKL